MDIGYGSNMAIGGINRKYVCWNITPRLCDDSFGMHLYVELVVPISHVPTVALVPVWIK